MRSLRPKTAKKEVEKDEQVRSIKDRLLERIKDMNDEKMLLKLNESLFGSTGNLIPVASQGDFKSVKSVKDLQDTRPANEQIVPNVIPEEKEENEEAEA
jgi:hypothetical protein